MHLRGWRAFLALYLTRTIGVAEGLHLDVGYRPWMIWWRDSMVRGMFVLLYDPMLSE